MLAVTISAKNRASGGKSSVLVEVPPYSSNERTATRIDVRPMYCNGVNGDTQGIAVIPIWVRRSTQVVEKNGPVRTD